MLCSDDIRAETVWVQRYNNEVPSDDRARRVVVDASGNLIVAGNTDAGFTGADILVIKYSPTGVALWTNRFDGLGNSSDSAAGLAVDGSGNVFVTGSSYNLQSRHDFATIGYSSEGSPLWTNFYGSPAGNDDRAAAIAVDGQGGVIVTGPSAGTTGLFAYDDYATIKYSNAGVALWTNRYNSSLDVPQAVAVDPQGNVFVTGSSSFISFAETTDYVTVAYSAAGLPLWTNRYNGPANNADRAVAIVADNYGKVVVTGYSQGGAASSTSDIATIAYTTGGTAIWTNRYNGIGNNADQPRAITTDDAGRTFVTGFSYSGITASSSDFVTIGYATNGAPLWVSRHNGSGNSEDVAVSLSASAGGQLYVSGYTWEGSTGRDVLTIAYSPTGVALWTNAYNRSGNSGDEPAAVFVGANGNVAVAGYSQAAAGPYDFTTLNYSAAGATLWVNHYNDTSQGNGPEFAKSVVVDRDGNVFVAGAAQGKGLVLAYTANGLPLWTNRFNGSATALALDPAGNLYVAGDSRGTNSGLDFVAIKYANDGIAIWTNFFTTSGNDNDSATAVAVDHSGNVIVTGTSGSGYATLKYSGTGTPLWTNFCSGIFGFDQMPALVLDQNDNVIVTGYLTGSGNPYDYLTVKYSAAGVPLWTNSFNAANFDDRAQAVAVDAAGNVFVTGYAMTNNSASSADYLTLAYSSAGTPLWTNRYNGSAGDEDRARLPLQRIATGVCL